MDLDVLLQPISEARPCGEDLSFSAEFDTIAELRREDDASLPLGEWKEKGKEPKVANWPELCALCESLLRTRSKDLRLVGWLADGWSRQRGLGALADGLALCTGLIDRHWAGLHPLPDAGDLEQRIGALSWLLGRVAPLARHAVADSAAGGVALRRPDALAAVQALAQLQQGVDARLGTDGPGFVAAREALKAVLADLPEDRQEPAQGVAPTAAGPAVAGALLNGPLQTRAQALQQLRQVADFFRRTEPHSPVAYLAEKAARWGAMDLQSWLRTVVKDHGSLAHLEELLGIEPPKPMN